MKIQFVLYLFAILTSIHSLLATRHNDTTYIQLKNVSVASHTAKLYNEKGRIFTAIDKAEIARTNANSIDQLLDDVPGMDMRQRGTHGIQADMSIRGGTFDQVLVLLNGVNITDAQTGHFNMDIPLQISNLAKIEVLQGSSARVLGPNAFSGAINIVTDSNPEETFRANITAGSFYTFGQSVGGNFGNKTFRTFISTGHKNSRGYMPFTDFEMYNAFIHSVWQTSNVGKFDIQFATEQKAFGANSFYSLKYPNQFENTRTFFSSLHWIWSKGNLFYQAQVSWRRHHDRFELFRDSITTKPSWYKGHNYHLTDNIGGKISASYLSKIGKTTIDGEIRNEHIFSNTLGNSVGKDSVAIPFEKNKFFTKAYNRLISTICVNHAIDINPWYTSFGIASTHSNDFRFSTYGGIDIEYALRKNLTLYASTNIATRLPTFTDLFFSNAVQQGNIALRPERSTTIEWGTKINYPQWVCSVGMFYRIGKDVIDWIKLPASTAKYESSNVSEVNALGTDVSIIYTFKNVFIEKISLVYSYLHLNKTSEGFDSKYALDYLRTKIILKMDVPLSKILSTTWKVGYFDRAGNYDANTQVGLPATMQNYTPYCIMDGRLLWATQHYELFAEINNILNQHYADNGGIMQPKRNLNIGITLKF